MLLSSFWKTILEPRESMLCVSGHRGCQHWICCVCCGENMLLIFHGGIGLLGVSSLTHMDPYLLTLAKTVSLGFCVPYLRYLKGVLWKGLIYRSTDIPEFLAIVMLINLVVVLFQRKSTFGCCTFVGWDLMMWHNTSGWPAPMQFAMQDHDLNSMWDVLDEGSPTSWIWRLILPCPCSMVTKP